MAQVSRSVATLRIMGDDLIPDDITRLLGCSPTFAHSKGEKVVGRKAGFVRIAQFGAWHLHAVDREPEDMDDQIKELLDKLSPSIDIWSEISTKYEIDLFCGIFLKRTNEGFSISPQSLAALGSRGIEIDFDIYGGDEE